MTRAIWHLSLTVVIGLLSRPAEAQQKLPTVAEVMAKLKEKRERGGVERYKLKFEKTVFQEGRKGTPCRELWEYLIDWNSGRFREAGWNGCSREPREQIAVFDGARIKTQFRKVTKEGRPIGDGAWQYGMVTGGPYLGVYERDWWPVFFQHGAIASLRDHFYQNRLIFDPDPEKFFVWGELVRDGRKCISLKTFPEHPIGQMQYEYIIDPNKDWAVVGMTYFQKHKPSITVDIDVAAVKQTGSWSMRGWTYTSTDSKGMPLVVTKVKVADFTANVVLDENNPFDIVPPEGEKVGRSHYEQPGGAQEVKRTEYWYQVKNGKLVQISGPAPPIWDRLVDNWHWFALTAGLAAAAVVGARVRGWRHWRPTAPVPPSGG